MKKAIFITGGVLILMIVLAIWVYLFVFGTPQSADEIFANFGIGGGAVEETFTPGTPIAETAFNNVIEDRTFQQLTTKPVAGMVFISTTTVRYAEQGTGYIFDIDLLTGTETQVAGNTFTKVREAYFNRDGSAVAFVRDENRTSRITVGEIIRLSSDTFTFSSLNLPTGAYEPGFSASDATTTVRYLYEVAAGTEGHAYNIVTGNDTVAFSVPFNQARALWGSPTYVYTKPTADFAGYVYEIKSSVPAYVANGGAGLMATAYGDGLITTRWGGETLYSEAYPGGQAPKALPVEVIPEKCTSADAAPTEIVCAVPTNLAALGGTYPDDWYKGVVSFIDQFWLVDMTEGSALLLADPLPDTGREIDVSRLAVNVAGDRFVFINKNDNALWLLDLTDDSFVPDDVVDEETEGE